MSRFSDMLTEFFSKTWSINKVRCVECGHKWTAIYPNVVKGGQYKLQCPKCKKRNSEVINK